jgi:DNA-binding response OmpR family regulator
MRDWDDEVTSDGGAEVVSDDQQPPVRKKVLLVDDSETVLMVERVVLGRGPYDIIMARNGEEAVERALAEMPDLILLDVMMPRMNGFEVCKRLRQHEMTKHTPIIFVTTRSEGENVEAGFTYGGTDYVNKPFTGAELLAKLRTYLGQ